jgi:hypothetical protein
MAGRDSAAVYPYRRRITYKKVLYALPAIALLTLWVAVVVLAFGFGCMTRRATPRVLRRLLNQTTIGRVAITVLRPDLCDIDADTKVWVERAGRVRLDFGKWDAKDFSEEGIEMAALGGEDIVMENRKERGLAIRVVDERVKNQ